MQRSHLLRAATLLTFAVGACASTSTFPWTARELRSAEDTPVQFVTEDGSPPLEDACSGRLIDPRDQTRIRLVRSAATGGGYRGDYQVPDSRYGIGRNELLRIDCATGQALGIVPN